MKGKLDGKEYVMVGQTDWYKEAGRRPFREEGFTTELMRRIEAAADDSYKGNGRVPKRKRFVYVGLATAFLICIVIWQAGGLNNLQGLFSKGLLLQNAAVIQPTSEPTTAPQVYTPPIGSAEFEFSGKKYYMPLPLDRDKSIAYAVETSRGILWSPPPHAVNYNKRLDFHPTEPRVLYLSNRDNPELSASSATKVYSYPLFASDENTYNYVEGIYGVGNYAMLISFTRKTGTNESKEVKFSSIDVRKLVTGGTVVPIEIDTERDTERDTPDFSDYNLPALIGTDTQHEEIVFLSAISNEKVSYAPFGDVYNLKSGKKTRVVPTIDILDNGAKVTYEVAGEKRALDIILNTADLWCLDWWNKALNSR